MAEECLFCGDIMGSNFQLERHLQTHTRERPFECSLCIESFGSREQLWGHKRDRHRLRQCGWCRKWCAAAKFKGHQDNDCPGEAEKVRRRRRKKGKKKEQCGWCQKWFDKGKLKAHWKGMKCTGKGQRGNKRKREQGAVEQKKEVGKKSGPVLKELRIVLERFPEGKVDEVKTEVETTSPKRAALHPNQVSNLVQSVKTEEISVPKDPSRKKKVVLSPNSINKVVNSLSLLTGKIKPKGFIYYPLRCSKCGLHFKGQGELKTHLQGHTSPDDVEVALSIEPNLEICRFCSRGFNGKVNLSLHIIGTHTGITDPNSHVVKCPFALCNYDGHALKPLKGLYQHVSEHLSQKSKQEVPDFGAEETGDKPRELDDEDDHLQTEEVHDLPTSFICQEEDKPEEISPEEEKGAKNKETVSVENEALVAKETVSIAISGTDFQVHGETQKTETNDQGKPELEPVMKTGNKNEREVGKIDPKEGGLPDKVNPIEMAHQLVTPGAEEKAKLLSEEKDVTSAGLPLKKKSEELKKPDSDLRVQNVERTYETNSEKEKKKADQRIQSIANAMKKLKTNVVPISSKGEGIKEVPDTLRPNDKNAQNLSQISPPGDMPRVVRLPSIGEALKKAGVYMRKMPKIVLIDVKKDPQVEQGTINKNLANEVEMEDTSQPEATTNVVSPAENAIAEEPAEPLPSFSVGFGPKTMKEADKPNVVTETVADSLYSLLQKYPKVPLPPPDPCYPQSHLHPPYTPSASTKKKLSGDPSLVLFNQKTNSHTRFVTGPASSSTASTLENGPPPHPPDLYFAMDGKPVMPVFSIQQLNKISIMMRQQRQRFSSSSESESEREDEHTAPPEQQPVTKTTRAYHCLACSSKFDCRAHLLRHLVTVHCGRPKKKMENSNNDVEGETSRSMRVWYTCVLCTERYGGKKLIPTRFSTEELLRQHVSEDHADQLTKKIN